MKYIRNLFKNVDKPLYLLPLLFAIISITMMFSTSYNNGITLSKTVIIQTFAYVLGFVAMLFIGNLNYTVLEDITKPLYIFSVLFLLTPYIPGLGVETYGARSWINLGITTFQPSEIVKLTFMVCMATYVNKRRGQFNHFKDFVLAALYAAPIILIVLKEDFGSAAVFVFIFIAMLLYAQLDLKLFGKIIIGIVIIFPILFSFLKNYQKQRLTAFLYPDDLTIEATYQVWQSKIAIGSGGLWGKGLFHGTQKDLQFLPVRNSDFIFSVICEELGFIGGAVLICLFIWFLVSLVKLAYSINDQFASLVVIGCVGMFGFQVVENIAMCMGLLPVTGITLPFISYGGSSILSNMLAVSLVINIASNNRGVAFLKP